MQDRVEMPCSTHAAAAPAHAKPKVVLVCGNTGAGKSKVAVELALALDAEIVNADAMQMYDGLSIATAKVTEEEMKGVPHHLLSIFPLTTQIDVRTFRDRALQAISEIHARGKLPIIVGGTNYYIDSLLKEGSLVDDLPQNIGQEHKGDEETSSTEATAELYEQLLAADPEFATLIHPHDRRKIMRGLQILRDTQQLPSLIFQAQEGIAGDRFHCYTFWVHSAAETLTPRLEARVEDMVSAGLLPEVEEVFETLKTELPVTATSNDENEEQSREADLGFTGISQAIGFKEFLPLLRTGAVLYDPETLEPTAEATECIQRVTSNTIRYAKKQLMWLRNKLFSRDLPVFMIDTTNSCAEVLEPQINAAVDIIQSFVNAPAALPLHVAYANWVREAPSVGEGCQDSDLPLPLYDASARPRNADFDEQYKRIYSCEVCGGKSLQGKLQWDIHVRSRSHRRMTKKKSHRGATDSPPAHRQKTCDNT